MNTGLLNVLHDAADDHICAVADGINIDFNGSVEEVVQQYRAVVGDQYRTAHIAHQLVFTENNFHGSAAQHIRWPNHQRVTNLAGRNDTLFKTPNSGVFRLLEAQALNHLLKTLTIFRPVNRIRAGSDNRYAGSFQAPSQFQRCLATVLNNHAFWLLDVDDFKHVLERNRLKVQPIRGIVIR